MWNADLVFRRDQGERDWYFWEAYVFTAPLSNSVADIIGFLHDFPARERAVGGLMRDYAWDRARAGHPGGPSTAFEVGRWWERHQPSELPASRSSP